VARRFGRWAATAPGCCRTRHTALLSLGRREEAERLLAEVFEMDLVAPANWLRPLIARATLRAWRGDLAAAQADFKRVLEESPAPLDPQTATPVFSGLAAAALWDGRVDDARAAVADGLAILATADERLLDHRAMPRRDGGRGGSRRAARARHADAEERTARELAAGIIDRARAVAAAPAVRVTPTVAANLVTAEAEWSRVTGPSDPEQWASCARAWEALGHPWPAAYARWRQAEALLVRRAPRQVAGAALGQAWALAGGLGSPLLHAEIEALGRRARIELAPGGGAGGSGARARAVHRRAGLTLKGARGARAGRRRPHQPADRRGAVHQRQDRQRARVQHPGQARRGQPQRGRRGRPPASTSWAEAGAAYPVARRIVWTWTGAQVPYRASAPSPVVREPRPRGIVTRMRDPATVVSQTLGSP
jgi:tetratricopeptide (TPR) repeat protein